ncbi:hypothetical protein GCM10027396_33890 [Insolitispirillum peregrinum]
MVIRIAGSLHNQVDRHVYDHWSNKDVERCSTPRWGQSAPDPIPLITKEKWGFGASGPEQVRAAARSCFQTVVYCDLTQAHWPNLLFCRIVFAKTGSHFRTML